MISADDCRFLEHARRLAAHGLGRAEPNPLVGCVITKNGSIVGEGFHKRCGDAHAEPNALADCRSRGHDPRGATVYVTLEPCCHRGKPTPRCVPRLIEAGVARVVVGTIDPDPDVNGQGIEQLRAAKIDVDLLDETESKRYRQLIAPYIARVKHDRPYVTMKWAETADGFVADENHRQLTISNAAASQFLHRLRARVDAIAVGIGTVLADNPRLNPRNVDIVRESRTVVFDRLARTPVDANLFLDGQRDVLIFTTCPFDPSKKFSSRTKIIQLEESNFLADAIRELGKLSPPISHLVIEAGPTLARAIFESNQCDRLLVNRSKTILKNPNALRATSVPDHFKQAISIDLDGDEYIEFLNTRSDVFFDLSESADFIG